MSTNLSGEDLIHRIIGLAMEISGAIGSGLSEDEYKKEFESRLSRSNIEPNRQYQVTVISEGEPSLTYRMDLFPNKQVGVGVKAFEGQLTQTDLEHFVDLLKAANAPIGLLFNFGCKNLEYIRINPKRPTKFIHRLRSDNSRKTRHLLRKSNKSIIKRNRIES